MKEENIDFNSATKTNIPSPKELLTVSRFYKQLFGEKIYKISIDAGCTCPNRDGKKSLDGCIFCSAKGSGDFAASRNKSINEQIIDAKKLLSPKLKNKAGLHYIAYFQNFSNTYGDAKLLSKKYMEAASNPDIVGVAIATRPDCLSEEILEQLGELSKKTFVQLELGFQTSNENTGILINRCYTNEDFTQAVYKIRKASKKIHIVAHIIFGLPGETQKDMLESVKFVCKTGVDGIKFTVLHVLMNTKLNKLYEKNEFKCLSMEEYFEILYKAVKNLPEDVVVHRLTGDGPKSILVAPLWTADKKNVHNKMKKYFLEKGISI